MPTKWSSNSSNRTPRSVFRMPSYNRLRWASPTCRAALGFSFRCGGSDALGSDDDRFARGEEIDQTSSIFMPDVKAAGVLEFHDFFDGRGQPHYRLEKSPKISGNLAWLLSAAISGKILWVFCEPRRLSSFGQDGQFLCSLMPQILGVFAAGDEFTNAGFDAGSVLLVGDAEPRRWRVQYLHAGDAVGDQLVDGGGDVTFTL